MFLQRNFVNTVFLVIFDVFSCSYKNIVDRKTNTKLLVSASAQQKKSFHTFNTIIVTMIEV